MSVIDSIQNFFSAAGQAASTAVSTAVDTVLPSGETMYENNFSKKVNNEFQGQLDYQYAEASKPNPNGYLLPNYDRSDMYNLKGVTSSPMFKTNFNGVDNPETRQAGVVYSELTGKPMVTTPNYLENSVSVRKSLEALNVENPAWARKMEYFGNNDMYQPKTVSSWSDFHAPVTQNTAGVPIYSYQDLERTKDTFNINKEMTNIPPTPQIRVSSRRDGAIRVKPRPIEETRYLTNQKVNGTVNKYFGNAGESVSALPTKFIGTKDYNQRRPIRVGDANRNETRVDNQLFLNPQSKPTKKEKLLFQYVGNAEGNKATQQRDGTFSKTTNRVMFTNYKGLETSNTGQYIDNRQFTTKPKRHTQTLFAGKANHFFEPERETVVVENNNFNRVLDYKFKNKPVYTNRPLFSDAGVTLDVWKPKLQQKRQPVHNNTRLLYPETK